MSPLQCPISYLHNTGCVDDQTVLDITVSFPKFHQPEWDGFHNPNIYTVICVLLCLVLDYKFQYISPPVFKRETRKIFKQVSILLTVGKLWVLISCSNFSATFKFVCYCGRFLVTDISLVICAEKPLRLYSVVILSMVVGGLPIGRRKFFMR